MLMFETAQPTYLIRLDCVQQCLSVTVFECSVGQIDEYSDVSIYVLVPTASQGLSAVYLIKKH